ncbi:MAG TPA: short-chain dehydrogenase, partial [Terriglobia bacterium]|nr:short-chain dehydrogenase [Terriglobia bacterium]
QNELQGTGVTVTVFCPGVTQTEFRSRAGIGQRRTNSGMTAAEAAQIGFRETMKGTYMVVPGVVNRIFVLAVSMLPVRTVSGLVRFINRQRGQDQ